MARRNFTRQQKEDIVLRATDEAGTVSCEKCKVALKRGSWEIDHILAEALRPEADKKVKITLAEGQLLGKDCCHRGPDGKTNKDVAQIAKAKRQHAGHNGIKSPPKGRGFPKPAKEQNPARKPPLQFKQLFTGDTRS
jgi:hypothetical protein